MSNNVISLKKGILLILFIVSLVWLLSRLTLTGVPPQNPADLMQNPIPLPSFLFRVDKLAAPSASWLKAICFEIDQSKIWRVGDKASDLAKNIANNMSITIDGVLVTQTDIFRFSTLDENARVDPIGFKVLLGTYSSSLTTCFNTENLMNGLYIAHIETKSTWNDRYSYTWAFQVS